MPMRYAFVLNPAAQNGRAARRRPSLEAALTAAGASFTVFETEQPGHGERLAREAAAEHAVVVAVGGDGTVQEVARGVFGTDAAMGVLPFGTGNDFAHALGMPDALEAAVRALLAAETVPVDVGRVRWQERADGGALATHERLFTNCLGAGFDALAAFWARRYKRLGGRGAYVASVLRALWQWRQPDVQVEILAARTGGGPTAVAPPVEAMVGGEAPSATAAPFGLTADEGEVLHEGGLFLVEVCNGFSVGGGFLLTPEAEVDDGLLDVCYVEHVTTRRALRLMPKTFTGAHVGEPEVALHRTPRVTIRSNAPLPVQADGEILTRGALALDAEVLPAALRLRAPRLRRPGDAAA